MGARDARVWLPLTWVFIVLLFFSVSPGKRGIYILPALPALAIASLPFIGELLAEPQNSNRRLRAWRTVLRGGADWHQWCRIPLCFRDSMR